jgi:metal-sulfur cluster biosynthetic enzyme
VGLNIVDMGLVYGIEFPEDGVIQVHMTLTTRGCPMGSYMTGEVQRTLGALSGVREVKVEIVWEPQWSPGRIKPGALEALHNGNDY